MFKPIAASYTHIEEIHVLLVFAAAGVFSEVVFTGVQGALADLTVCQQTVCPVRLQQADADFISGVQIVIKIAMR